MTGEQVDDADVFKALGDPIRWSIVQQIAAEDEFPCRLLEDTLPVSKPTISYHTKVLTQAGLITVRKRGRNYYYAVRHDVLRRAVERLSSMSQGSMVAAQTPPRVSVASTPAPALRAVLGEMPTW